MAHAHQERWSALTLAKLRSESVFLNLFNRRYEGSPTAGAVKIPVRDTEVAVGSYTITTGGTLTHGTTTYKTLPIDKDYCVNELVDGYDADAVPDNLIADRLDSAGYALGHQTDTDLIALLLDSEKGGSVLSNTTALTASTIYGQMVKMIQQAKKLGIKKSEMWFALTNDMVELLLTCDKFTQASPLGDNVIQNGEIGRVSGVRVYETSNIADSTKVEMILGNDVFCHYVNEWSVPVSVNTLADGAHIGASAVQGRLVAGAMLSRPTTILIKKHA